MFWPCCSLFSFKALLYFRHLCYFSWDHVFQGAFSFHSAFSFHGAFILFRALYFSCIAPFWSCIAPFCSCIALYSPSLCESALVYFLPTWVSVLFYLFFIVESSHRGLRRVASFRPYKIDCKSETQGQLSRHGGAIRACLGLLFLGSRDTRTPYTLEAALIHHFAYDSITFTFWKRT